MHKTLAMLVWQNYYAQGEYEIYIKAGDNQQIIHAMERYKKVLTQMN